MPIPISTPLHHTHHFYDHHHFYPSLLLIVYFLPSQYSRHFNKISKLLTNRRAICFSAPLHTPHFALHYSPTPTTNTVRTRAHKSTSSDSIITPVRCCPRAPRVLPDAREMPRDFTISRAVRRDETRRESVPTEKKTT